MQIFRNRPMALAMCVLAIVSVLTARLQSGARLSLLIVSLLLLLLSVVLYISFQKVRRVLLCLLLCVCGAAAACISSVLFFDVRLSNIESRIGDRVEIEGVVLERGTSLPYMTELRVEIYAVDGESVFFGAAVECSYASSLQVGDQFRMTVIPRSFSSDELFDERTFRLSDGCLCALTCSDPADSALIGYQNGFKIWASKLNTRLSYGLMQTLGRDAGSLSAALLLGNRRFLHDDVTLAFRRSGVSHLLALSGLHVSILIGFAEIVMRAIRIPKRWRIYLIPSLGVFYLILTGCSVSTERAVILMGFLYCSMLIGEIYDSFSALSLALGLILMITPYAVLDLSLWMSFFSAASIVVFSPAVYRWSMSLKLVVPTWAHKALSALISAFCTGFFASAALLLLSASVFEETSLLAIPVTMLMSFPITALLILSLAVLCFPFLRPLVRIVDFLGGFVLDTVQWGSNLKNVLLPMNDPYSQAALAALSALMVLLAIGRIKRPIAVLSPLSLFCLSICLSLCVTYLPKQEVWQADERKAGHGKVRLYTNRGEAVLVNATRGNASEDYEIHAMALKRRCTEIGDMVLSRYYNQANYFIRTVSGEIKVRRLHMPMPQDEREWAIAARLADEARLYEIEVAYDAEFWLTAYEKIG